MMLACARVGLIISYDALFRYDKGGHLFLPSYIMRTHGSRKQQDVIKNVRGTQMQKVFEVLYTSFFFHFNLKGRSIVDS